MGNESDPPLVSPAAPDSSIDHAHSIEYWNSVSSDINGMLGGFPQTSRIDLQGSSNFLVKFRRGKQRAVKQNLPSIGRAADCGAGIGRITKGLLMGVSSKVDIIEPVKKFTDEFMVSLQEEEKDKVGVIVNLGLQDWVPEPGAYGLIWNQWCLGHLTDAQVVAYLRRCSDGLVKSSAGAGATSQGGMQQGWIVVKENMSATINDSDIYDDEDSSVTRSDTNFRRLFKEAGLKIVAEEVQRGFPKGLFTVRMYALQPE
ncbi:hypothetical protein BU24DRAFT_362609 [Aaosphaeria arxii CBS 175.79]|uniref:Alpha N-terminal protein methyltransferase 1 n=1 Tax=Aaosphaeria arxii CBS 175.79 TaxID=1450172 RepID=A0A6A5Y9U5_9PLEO|nr:uncharacterized protein BU24DRAFT_362609 [Aaosphaeria arxii CBS 175.79]KAF2021787.1 hypothetical protein BU24DRAFT_362609 [Aaosphaeria arxii CBS 175.79]